MMVDPTYERQAQDLQSALIHADSSIDFYVYTTAQGLFDGSEIPHYDDMVCVVRAMIGEQVCMLPVSRPLLEREGSVTVAKMLLPGIRYRLASG